MNKLMLTKTFFIIIFFSLLVIPSGVFAQTVPLQTQKKVVSSFKLASAEQYFPFSRSDCNLKSRGDANCDGVIDQFDLSIWQVEINSEDSPLRSDFNSDGVINLLDYGIWRSTVYPQTAALSFKDCQSSVVKLLNCSIVAFQQLSSLAIEQSLPNVNAEEAPPLPTLASSQTLISTSGDNQIVNTATNGSTQQISFDSNGNITTAEIFSSLGPLLAGISFLDDGGTVVNTQESGVSVQIHKTAQGPVIEGFYNPDGSLIAIKSWPSLSSLENNDPPISVSIPVKNNSLLTLNINPNGSGIITQTDNQGTVLNESQYREDGTYISQDSRFQITTEANDKIGLSTIQLPNALGGKATYHFYKAGLFAIVQTDSQNNYYIAKPLDETGENWSLVSNTNGQITQSNTTDPVGQIGAQTPSPKEIIRDINYYKSLPSNSGVINFVDGFGASDKILPAQLSTANEILKITDASPPSLTTLKNSTWQFGVKEAHAQSNSAGAAAASAASLAASNNVTGQTQTGTGSNSTDVQVGADGSQTTSVTNASGSQIASSTTSTRNANNTSSGNGTSTSSNMSAITQFISGGLGTPLGTPTTEEIKGPTTCFLAGTKISTPLGPIKIETLKPGMEVYSYNEKTGQKEIADFKELDINFVDEYLIINNQINTTTYHPFYVWDETSELLLLVKAGKLKIGDLLVDELGNHIPITSIQKVSKKETVYNLLTVAPNDNFYAEGILVHNYNNNDAYTASHNNNATENNNNDPGSYNSETF